MRVGGAAAATFLILALALGTTACGDSTKKRQAAAARARADANWRAGIVRWQKEMLGALNGISLLLSAERPIELLQAADPATDAALEGFERSLARCSEVLHRLGPAPPALADARRFALRACVSLEAGSRLVETAVQGLRRGLGGEGFNLVVDPLTAGQNEMDIAATQARRAPSP